MVPDRQTMWTDAWTEWTDGGDNIYSLQFFKKAW